MHDRALILIFVVGNEGTRNLGAMLNPSGATGQMFNPSVALGQGGLPGMMGGRGKHAQPQDVTRLSLISIY